ncbi:Ferric siderophore transport system, periplasmic binding protein TonB [Croceitalea dokdonensis DOKDO 023]|uniref:Ferric siderophore transport system, periplasmic binding protein TonB n=1 Tax=Croceitalea dokdonensis DOKDO 023 TaxID=1300341 RepID=A0A0N8H3R1_9FLAO|nr:energy transducer TonB [Croceitalea dokdonensis]KPM31276.1 Ferric siderophore transport system, periplasmic binding protein TonB [Croceitalea dokdonensis DOKDO 023]
MELKKNPKADLNRNSGLYFVIGLTVVLFTTYTMLEYKSYESNEDFAQVLDVQDDMDEEVPITEMLRTAPPPPPPSAPEVIEIIEDVEDVEETIIESTESSQDTYIEDNIISLDGVDMDEAEEDIIVPFAIIENAPVFPGCEGLSSEAERKACFNSKIQEHIRANFNYPEAALEMQITGRVFVQFEINSKGQVTGIKKRGPDRMLESEAERIISKLPTMKPAMQRGKPARIAYSVPINFIIQS